MVITRRLMRPASALVAALAVVASVVLPASARSSYVQDDAKLFSAATVSSLDSTIGEFNRQTGKEVVVVTVASLDGATAPAAAEKAFAQQQVNGVLVYLSKAEKKQGIVPDRAAASFFPPGEVATIRDAMRGYFRTGDFDTGITTGVNLILDQYRSHVRAVGAPRQRQLAPNTQSFGGGMSLLWLILILIAGFLIIRAIFRAISGRRTMPPGYGGGPGYGAGGPGGYGGGPGYGGPGYGGMGGGGGNFFSGLLGGLGGAFIGNELFGRHDGGGFGDSSNAGMMGGDQGGQSDTGFQNDAGQADMGNASFGDYGSSGGGFGDGGGGGDFGGGGGDSGGGGW